MYNDVQMVPICADVSWAALTVAFGFRRSAGYKRPIAASEPCQVSVTAAFCFMLFLHVRPWGSWQILANRDGTRTNTIIQQQYQQNGQH